jgi:hypothetical protein
LCRCPCRRALCPAVLTVDATNNTVDSFDRPTNQIIECLAVERTKTKKQKTKKQKQKPFKLRPSVGAVDFDFDSREFVLLFDVVNVAVDDVDEPLVVLRCNT